MHAQLDILEQAALKRYPRTGPNRLRNLRSTLPPQSGGRCPVGAEGSSPRSALPSTLAPACLEREMTHFRWLTAGESHGPGSDRHHRRRTRRHAPLRGPDPRPAGPPTEGLRPRRADEDRDRLRPHPRRRAPGPHHRLTDLALDREPRLLDRRRPRQAPLDRDDVARRRRSTAHPRHPSPARPRRSVGIAQVRLQRRPRLAGARQRPRKRRPRRRRRRSPRALRRARLRLLQPRRADRRRDLPDRTTDRLGGRRSLTRALRRSRPPPKR